MNLIEQIVVAFNEFVGSSLHLTSSGISELGLLLGLF